MHLNCTISDIVVVTPSSFFWHDQPATEMVIGVQALVHNEIRVVQSSLLGSVLSNLLFVMGCCFLFGGIKHQEQKFNSTASVANLSLLFLATIALVVPTPVG